MPTEQFFEELGQRGSSHSSPSSRDVCASKSSMDAKTSHWIVAIDKGNLEVSRDGGDRACSIRATRRCSIDWPRGEENAMAATLRGALVCTGDVDLLLAIQRVFPGPPR